MLDADGLKSFYLIKCYEKPEYRRGFNTGTNIHINGMRHFFNLESEFQKDTEGLIFEQSPNKRGYLFCAPSNMSEILRDEGYLLQNNSQIAISQDDSSQGLINCFLKNAKLFSYTDNVRLSVCGYICCFYLIPKRNVHFLEKEIAFRTETDKAAFFEFLSRYTETKNVAYISVYDAYNFVEKFYEGMTQKGYEISFAPINYVDLSPEIRVKWFSSGDIEKIVFTKDKRFAYQKEFRIFLTKPREKQAIFIEESGIDFQQTIVTEFVYLSPEYATKQWRKKHEIQLQNPAIPD